VSKSHRKTLKQSIFAPFLCVFLFLLLFFFFINFLSLRLFERNQICIVNSHLNAHFENVARRNQDMKDIARRIIFYNDDASMYSIYEHEYVYYEECELSV
jgi:hypothetical protein